MTTRNEKICCTYLGYLEPPRITRTTSHRDNTQSLIKKRNSLNPKTPIIFIENDDCSKEGGLLPPGKIKFLTFYYCPCICAICYTIA